MSSGYVMENYEEMDLRNTPVSGVPVFYECTYDGRKCRRLQKKS